MTDIPAYLKVDHEGKKFLWFDSGYDDPERFLIFCSEYKKKYFEKIENVLIDGTFYVAPTGFKQLLTIQAFIFSKARPYVYVFLNGKSEETYKKVFYKIINLFNLQPKLIIIDFEISLINACEKVFLHSKISCCYFHFCQSIWRKVQSMDCTKHYKENSKFRICVKKIFSLAFLREEDVLKGYEIVKKDMEDLKIENIAEFLKYIERTYIGWYNDAYPKYNLPLYKISRWNIYNSIFNDHPRTNNSTEAWHRVIKSKVIVCHPNIAFLHEKLLDQEVKDRYVLIQSFNGIYELPKINYLKEQKLKILVKNYDFLDISVYMSSVVDVYDWILQ